MRLRYEVKCHMIGAHDVERWRQTETSLGFVA